MRNIEELGELERRVTHNTVPDESRARPEPSRKPYKGRTRGLWAGVVGTAKIWGGGVQETIVK